MAFLVPALALSLLFGDGSPPDGARTAPEGSEFFDGRWDDGLAEVARYQASRVVYGRPRAHEVVMVTCVEHHDSVAGVKAETLEGRDLRAVIKLHLFQAVPAGAYPYHLAATAFVERRAPMRLVKLTTSSQEWCGITHKRLAMEEDGAVLSFDSYWDGEGVGRTRLAGEGRLLAEEQLLVSLRALDPKTSDSGAGAPWRVGLLDPLVGNRVGSPRFAPARIQPAGRETVEVPAGTFGCLRLEVFREGGREPDLVLWIEEAPRRAVVRLEAADGRRMELASIERTAYWEQP